MLLSKKELAKSLGVSTKTIERKINEGLIPYYKIGTLIRFDQNSIDQLLKHCRRNAIEGGAQLKEKKDFFIKYLPMLAMPKLRSYTGLWQQVKRKRQNTLTREINLFSTILKT